MESSGKTSGRVDAWLWAVRLLKTRAAAAAACNAGHVTVGGVRAKPATPVKPGATVEITGLGDKRVVVVVRVIAKRVGAPIAVACYEDHSPPPPPREFIAPAGLRDRGAGRPTKRERREIDRLRGRA
ncbi:RNA-binding S4 domain-containing protein [Rarobacter incanus]|uniref:Ribosome-associated heat shock protein Hsp15 n=1 Tax=Rarobacter incanus TaxID=153494 RepID=A0A542SPF3_9MICO|nr:S4 domain-containing protein [Rarobacter incanus]TQK76499.1 ribosome-associated heat shock protein Hsp15 [Rarobacter incanus]